MSDGEYIKPTFDFTKGKGERGETDIAGLIERLIQFGQDISYSRKIISINEGIIKLKKEEIIRISLLIAQSKFEEKTNDSQSDI